MNIFLLIYLQILDICYLNQIILYTNIKLYSPSYNWLYNIYWNMLVYVNNKKITDNITVSTKIRLNLTQSLPINIQTYFSIILASLNPISTMFIKLVSSCGLMSACTTSLILSQWRSLIPNKLKHVTYSVTAEKLCDSSRLYNLKTRIRPK